MVRKGKRKSLSFKVRGTGDRTRIIAQVGKTQSDTTVTNSTDIYLLCARNIVLNVRRMQR